MQDNPSELTDKWLVSILARLWNFWTLLNSPNSRHIFLTLIVVVKTLDSLLSNKVLFNTGYQQDLQFWSNPSSVFILSTGVVHNTRDRESKTLKIIVYICFLSKVFVIYCRLPTICSLIFIFRLMNWKRIITYESLALSTPAAHDFARLSVDNQRVKYSSKIQ